jgi:hypothetical protein
MKAHALCLLLLVSLCLTLRAETPAPVVDWKGLDRTVAEISNGMQSAKIAYPDDLHALDGKPVSIVGFMTPFEDLDDMGVFLLMPTSGGCFFCNPPSITQVLYVQQPKDGKKHDYIGEPIIVTGTLRLYTKESKHPAHVFEFLYALDDAKVEVYKPKSPPAVSAK